MNNLIQELHFEQNIDQTTKDNIMNSAHLSPSQKQNSQESQKINLKLQQNEQDQSNNSTYEDQFGNDEDKDQSDTSSSSDQNVLLKNGQLSDINEELDNILNDDQKEQSQQFVIKNLDDGEKKDLFQKDVTLSATKKQRFAIIKKQSKQHHKKRWNQYWKTIQRFNDLLLDYCVTGEYENMVELFKEHLAYPVSVNITTLDNWTPLHTAVNNGHRRIVEYLLEKHAEIMAKTSSLRTVLHLAVEKTQKDLIKLFLDKKIMLINSQDTDKQTPVHHAAQLGDLAVVKLLLAYNPNIKLKNKDGFTPLELSRNIEIMNQFLIYQQQNINDYDNNQNEKYNRTIFKKEFLMINNRTDQIQKIIELTYELGKNKNQFKQFKKSSEIQLAQSYSPKERLFGSEENETILSGSGNKAIRNTLKKIEKIQIIMKEAKIQMIQSSIYIYYKQISQILLKDLRNTLAGPDDFQVLSILGKGSFGKVYLVKKKDNEKHFALKSLEKIKVFSKNLVKYALTERNILSKINHPFIVKLHHSFQTLNKLYLVMDYCPGGDLDQKLFTIQKMNENVAKIYLAEVLLALECLHENNIVFRDLKPSNIVLDQDGHACLTDFGLAKENVKKNSKLQSFCGSIAYLAPEMLAKSGHDFTIDWYLYGVLIYELLSGYPPYYNENKQKLLENIKSAPITFPRYFSKNAKDLIDKLIKRKPESRLGKNGASEIKQHQFFSNIDFNKILKKQYKMPVITSTMDEIANQDQNIIKKRNLQITISKNEDIQYSQEDGGEQYLENWNYTIQEDDNGENIIEEEEEEEIYQLNQHQKQNK